ncbi:hypothetical protein DPEC_G00293740 [Dallia pectoralis]|uniref:Uncharacterized protein n=1 Tax=Dallia pectoralis TaxID=75939 RepID=A0ACC2FIB0_DALPE|nr:hypothetical protein DPEC_G00293740 [Dallia pectoralis]
MNTPTTILNEERYSVHFCELAVSHFAAEREGRAETAERNEDSESHKCGKLGELGELSLVDSRSTGPNTARDEVFHQATKQHLLYLQFLLPVYALWVTGPFVIVLLNYESLFALTVHH